MRMRRHSLYLFYGDDPLSIHQAIASLRERLGPSADMNLQRFEAANLDLNELQQVCQALPFLADRRLILVERADELPRRADFTEALRAQLEALPESTALVFVAELDPKAAADFERRSPIYAWASDHPEASFVRRYTQPTGPALSRWLIERAAELGATLEPQAAELLASLVDEDLRLADQELRKLVDYRDPITAAAVEQLTPVYGQTDVFAVVDGLAGDGAALGKLHRLLQEQDPSYVFLMVARQFRLLLQARQALDRGRDPVASVDAPAFVARKVAAQARSFSAVEIETTFRNLIRLEVAAKRGEADLALDLIPLLTDFAQRH